MNTLTTLTESEVKQLVDDWYLKLDVHAPIAEVLPLLAGETLEMQLPETTLHGLDGFRSWYDRVIHTFFDEVHTLQTLDITIDGDREARHEVSPLGYPKGLHSNGCNLADVQLVVRWEASRWNAPAPKSERLAFDAAQRWVVVRSPQTQQPAIVTYIVDSLTTLPGFPNL
ncbi:MAG: hypothetical protein KME09_26200 [Pleurocapsa minor HA4230-MV1]|jgi:hypothetical protein|nr:hypothetical protein [Pleurocapsa minor HA4230-MV1]